MRQNTHSYQKIVDMGNFLSHIFIDETEDDKSYNEWLEKSSPTSDTIIVSGLAETKRKDITQSLKLIIY